MQSSVSTPQTVTIPRPMKLQRRSGIESTNAFGKCYQLRLHNMDAALLNEEAKALGITRSELMRWLAVFGAAALHKQRTGKDIDVVP